jgi:hypothetical protein
MNDRPTSAAASLYPHLPHDDGRTAEWAKRAHTESVGAALYPQLKPPQPLAPNRYRGNESLAARADADPWFELRLAKMGLIRRR